MQKTFKYDGSRWTCRIDITDGSMYIAHMPRDEGASIAVYPADGGSVQVFFSASSIADLNAGDHRVAPARGLGPAGTVTEPTIDSIPTTVTAVVVIGTPGSRVEIAQ